MQLLSLYLSLSLQEILESGAKIPMRHVFQKENKNVWSLNTYTMEMF